MRLATLIILVISNLLAFQLPAYAQLFFSNAPDESTISSAVTDLLPDGSRILDISYEVFPDDQGGTGRVSVAGNYALDRDYYLISQGPDEIVRRLPQELNANSASFMQFWRGAAGQFDGQQGRFSEARLSVPSGTSLRFSGSITYIREVNGYRFQSAGFTKELPRGQPDLASAILISSSTFEQIRLAYLDYSRAEQGRLDELRSWIEDKVAGKVYSVTYETKKISEIWIDKDMSIFYPEGENYLGMVRFAAYATQMDVATEKRTINNWIGTVEGSESRVVVWGSIKIAESGKILALFNVGSESDYNSGVSWTYGYSWDESRGIFAGQNYDRNTFAPCLNCTHDDAKHRGVGAPETEFKDITDVKEIIGDYQIIGTTATGSSYEGTSRISAGPANDTVNFDWSLGVSTFSGTGRIDDGILLVDWTGESVPKYLPTSYHMDSQENLVGNWSIGAGSERLVRYNVSNHSPPAFSRSEELKVLSGEVPIDRVYDLAGTYSARGLLDSGKEDYTASVLVSANSDTGVASILWTSGNFRFTGTARAVNGVMTVNWNSTLTDKQLPIAYKMTESGKLVGIWQDGSRIEELLPAPK